MDGHTFLMRECSPFLMYSSISSCKRYVNDWSRITMLFTENIMLYGPRYDYGVQLHNEQMIM